MAAGDQIPTGNQIRVSGAREHNLKDISLELPRDALVVITGLSGSGKSSLAFDTIYAEGQRRYVESLSAYARQFLGQMDKPDVDSIEGLSPAISIDQKTTSRNPRSTVGTVTEIYDYLRLLWSRVGKPHCPICGRPIVGQSAEQIVDQVMELGEGTRFMVLAPIVRGRKGEYGKLLDELRADGFARVKIDDRVRMLEESIVLDKRYKHDISVVVDRLVMRHDLRKRLADSIETAVQRAEGLVEIEIVGAGKGGKERRRRGTDGAHATGAKGTRAPSGQILPGEVPEPGTVFTYSERFACPEHGPSLVELEPRVFSFNSPHGACDRCTGLGSMMEIDPELVVPDPSLSIGEGAIAPWASSASNYYDQMTEAIAEEYGVDLDAPWEELPEEQRDVFLYGTGGEPIQVTYRNRFGRRRSYADPLRGHRAQPPAPLPRDGLRVVAREDRGVHVAAGLPGVRRRAPAARVPRGAGGRDPHRGLHRAVGPPRPAVAGGGRAVRDRPPRGAPDPARDLRTAALPRQRRHRLPVDGPGRRHAVRRRGAADPPGDPDRLLAGGRAVHPRRALDRPAPARQLEADRHARAAARPRQHGDRGRARRADDARRRPPRRPRPGRRRARRARSSRRAPPPRSSACPSRSPASTCRAPRTIEAPAKRRTPSGYIEILGASQHNLRDIDVHVPLGVLTCVTGVSGSGKSTLVNDVLYKAVANRLHRARQRPGSHRAIHGLEQLDKIIAVDQSPIGRTPRSNPATYTGLFDVIRDLFSKTQEARARGYKPGRFSFNVKGGRCEVCRGDGQIKIEMHFLPDVYVPCEQCHGKRYNRETLEVRFKGKSIADVLDMPVEEALHFFEHIPKVRRRLETLDAVGLGYVRLGQPATTLSGGEAQRVKLATELSKIATGRTLYILDEPTTGLHFADVQRLLEVLQRLVDAGNSVVVIEHNLDVIKSADRIIDMGPEGGEEGGIAIAAGTPEEVALEPASHTGQFLVRAARARRRARGRPPRRRRTKVAA